MKNNVFGNAARPEQEQNIQKQLVYTKYYYKKIGKFFLGGYFLPLGGDKFFGGGTFLLWGYKFFGGTPILIPKPWCPC